MNPARVSALTVVDELVRCGLRRACIAPGSRSTPLAIALHDHPGVQTHMVIDERSAAFLALGIGKISRTPAAVLSTSGTAAANFYPAVVEASLARVPLIVLTADRPPELRDTGANQTIDQIKLYGGFVRWFVETGTPDGASPAYWRSVAARAWSTAMASPPGPVHLNFAFREPLVGDGTEGRADLGGRPGGRPWISVEASASAPSLAAVAELTAAAASKRGLIVAGDRSVEPEPVERLARATGWPILAEAASGLRRGELAISSYDALLRIPEFASAHRPDFVVRIGKTGTSKALSAYLDATVDQVLVDPDGEWLDPDRSIRRIVRAEPEGLCAAVAARIGSAGRTEWSHSWLSAEKRARAAIDTVLDATSSTTEPRTARDLARFLPDGAVLVAASSMPVRDLDWFMEPRAGLHVLANRGASGIDGFVSTVLGAALAGDRPVVALAGDLSMLHDSNGLALARREAVDAVFVVLNNDGGGIFSFLPQATDGEAFETLFATPHGIDFSDLSRLHGCKHVPVAKAGDVEAAVLDSMGGGGVALVEVRTDRSENVSIHKEIWEAVAQAVT